MCALYTHIKNKYAPHTSPAPASTVYICLYIRRNGGREGEGEAESETNGGRERARGKARRESERGERARDRERVRVREREREREFNLLAAGTMWATAGGCC